MGVRISPRVPTILGVRTQGGSLDLGSRHQVGSIPTAPTAGERSHETIQRKVYLSTGLSYYPWNAPWWVQRTVTPRRFYAEWFDSTSTDNARMVKWKTRWIKDSVPSGVGVRLPLRAQYPGGGMVDAVGSGSAVFGFEGSTPSLGTHMPR